MSDLLSMLPPVPKGTSIAECLELFSGEGMPFAAAPVDIDGVNYNQFIHQPAHLRDMLLGMMQDHLDQNFIVYGDERLTFGQTFGKIAQLTQVLCNDYGISKGDKVAISMRNYPEWVIAYIAIISVGGVACAMNAWWTAEEVEQAFKITGSKLAICDSSRANRIETFNQDMAIKLIVVRDDNPARKDAARFEEAIADKDPSVIVPIEITQDDDAHIIFTSGSSGFPKAALATHRAVVSVLFMWLNVAISIKSTRPPAAADANQPASAVTIPFFHVTGLVTVMLVSVLIGRKLVIMHKWDVEEAFRLIEAERVTNLSGVPSMSYEMSISPLRHKYDLTSLTDIGGGGAARPSEHLKLLVEAFENFSPGLGYGMTETSSVGTLISGDDYTKRSNSSGKATPPIVEIKIVAGDGSEMPTGERGEICIKSTANIRCYYGNPEATAELIKDGWLHTGDVGYLDVEGYLFIVDRLKDIIIRGGENISTLEVEAALAKVDGVEDCMVFSLPDEMLGEIIGAVIAVADTIDIVEVQQELGRHIANFKVPQVIWPRTVPLPLIASGKIDRKNIKQEYQALYAQSK